MFLVKESVLYEFLLFFVSFFNVDCVRILVRVVNLFFLWGGVPCCCFFV